MSVDERQVASARLLVSRLERLSADSYWAHQASGLRGSLLRCLGQFETKRAIQNGELPRLDELVERGYEILALAARSMHRPTPRSLKR